ncbi:unnamed protein product [Moneuplotes crassus]|uniref:Uncharacterized protein n=1 Tax=Euplotes crassus TaxID=5936 RepID=A0AAD1UTK8_EUPCR|nr:unnamed protein product [Moneuplotes crassus]
MNSRSNNQTDESKENYVDGRNVKTIRSLRKSSAKKGTQSSKSIRESNASQKDSRKDFKITKKKQANNSRMMDSTSEALNTSGMKNTAVPVLSKAAIKHEKKSASHVQNAGKRIPNKKHTVIKTNTGHFRDNSRGDSKPVPLDSTNAEPVSTLISATLNNKNNLNNTYITENTNVGYSKIGTSNGSRGESKQTANREKSGAGKRLPPGVRLYNQSKNPKGKIQGKKKNDAPPKPVLTKNVEEMLIQSNREKCEEIIKTSNEIHETLNGAGIDKSAIIEALFSDALFNHILANLLFHAKILGKSKLENFLHSRIKRFIKEYQTESQIRENLDNIHSRIADRIQKLKDVRKKYMEDMDK